MTGNAPPWNPRLLVVSFAAVAISLPIAWASLAKLLLALACPVKVACAALMACLMLAALDGRKFDPATARALWSLLAACAVAGMFNSVLYDDSIGDFFCIGAGLLLALGQRSPEINTKTP